jgi:hypothetical protein
MKDNNLNKIIVVSIFSVLYICMKEYIGFENTNSVAIGINNIDLCFKDYEIKNN